MSPHQPVSQPVASPISQGERIESIDILRGIAVFGILALNIQSFAMPGVAYMNPTAYGNFEGVNRWSWAIIHVLGDLKFWTIFSMLFGAGVVLMTSRCEARRGSAGIHYRRMGWLLVIGILHAHLIWYGDVLATYAMCGFLLYFVRKFRPWLLIGLGLVPLIIAFAISIGFGMLLNMENPPAEMYQNLQEAWTPDRATIAKELNAYRGNWLTQLPARSMTAFFFETFLFLVHTGWRSLGLMMIGMGLFKLGVFNARRSVKFYWTLVAIAVFVGVPIAAYGIYCNDLAGWSLEYSFYFGPLFNYWASIPIALGWVGVVMLACKSEILKPITRLFAAPGRMALTVYLLESVIATFIFYGHGLGRFGFMERWQQYLCVVGIWIALVTFANVWLRFFQFGPFEWLWRSLTYFRRQPLIVR